MKATSRTPEARHAKRVKKEKYSYDLVALAKLILVIHPDLNMVTLSKCLGINYNSLKDIKSGRYYADVKPSSNLYKYFSINDGIPTFKVGK